MDKANEVISERINAVKIDRAEFAERSEPLGMSEAAGAQEVLKRLANSTADESGTWQALGLVDGAAEDGDEPIVGE